MAIYYRTQGIILSSLDIGEADRFFTVFTEDFGKVRFRAVSERKITSKLRGGLGGCAIANLEFIQGRAGKTVTDAEVSVPYMNIAGDLRRMRSAFSILRSVDSLIGEEQREQKVWDLIKESLGALNQKALDTKTLDILPYYFLWNLISLTGYRPHLESCVTCRKGVEDREVWFYVEEGGVRCSQCSNGGRGIKLSPETLRQLKYMLKSDTVSSTVASMPTPETKAFRQTSRDYLTHVLESIS